MRGCGVRWGAGRGRRGCGRRVGAKLAVDGRLVEGDSWALCKGSKLLLGRGQRETVDGKLGWWEQRPGGNAVDDPCGLHHREAGPRLEHLLQLCVREVVADDVRDDVFAVVVCKSSAVCGHEVLEILQWFRGKAMRGEMIGDAAAGEAGTRRT